MRETTWTQVWSAHQSFFKYICVAAKVERTVQLAKEAFESESAVIVLSSIGEARTSEQMALLIQCQIWAFSILVISFKALRFLLIWPIVSCCLLQQSHVKAGSAVAVPLLVQSCCCRRNVPQRRAAAEA